MATARGDCLWCATHFCSHKAHRSLPYVVEEQIFAIGESCIARPLHSSTSMGSARVVCPGWLLTSCAKVKGYGSVHVPCQPGRHTRTSSAQAEGKQRETLLEYAGVQAQDTPLLPPVVQPTNQTAGRSAKLDNAELLIRS